MNKNLHDIDKLFLELLEKNEDRPSVVIKKNLMATLDKQHTILSQHRALRRVRWMVLLFLLLAGYIMIDSLTQNPRTILSGRDIVSKNAKFHTGKSNKINTQSSKNELGAHESGLKGRNRNTTGKPLSFKLYELFSPANASLTGKENNQPDFMQHSDAISEYSLSPTTRHPAVPVVITDEVVQKFALLQKPGPVIPFFSRKNSAEKIFKPNWQLSFFSSYDRTGYRLDCDDPVTISDIKHNEVHEPSFSGGVMATRQISKYLGLQTGLIYSYTAIGISPQKIYAFQDPAGDIAYKYITSSGYAYVKPSNGPPPAFGDSISIESKHQIKTISVPLSVNYKIGKKKLTIAPGAGVEAGFIINAKAEVELTDASSHETVTVSKLSGTKKFYWSAIANVELQYHISDKTSILLQPVYRQALSPITENNVVETFPFSFGIRAGLALKF